MSIESGIRALLLRAVAVTLPRPGADALASVKRVLVLRHDRIGDMLSSLPLIRALASRDLMIDVLASAENAVLLDGNPWGVGVVTSLAGRRYDAVVDALALKPSVNSRTVRLMRRSRAPVRVGIGARANDFIYTHRVRPADPGANHMEYLAELATPFGIGREEALVPVAMPLSAVERARAERWWDAREPGIRLFVNISAGGGDRRWPDARYAAVLARMAGERPELRIAVSSAPSDRGAAEWIAGLVGGSVVATSLRDAFAIVGASDLVLTPDTSVAHAAAGFQRPSVVLIAESQLQFAPWRSPARLVVTACDGLEAITEEEVTSALREVVCSVRTRS